MLLCGCHTVAVATLLNWRVCDRNNWAVWLSYCDCGYLNELAGVWQQYTVAVWLSYCDCGCPTVAYSPTVTTVAVDVLLWLCFCHTEAVAVWLLYCRCVATLLFCAAALLFLCGCRTVAVAALVWLCGCGNMAVAVWRPYCGCGCQSVAVSVWLS